MNQKIISLLEKYLVYFPEESQRYDILKQQLQNDEDMTTRKNFTGHVTATAIILDNDKKKFFLIHHKKLDIWIPPGGHFEEGDESMVDNATREAKEETGFQNLILHSFHEEHNMIPLDVDSHYIPENPKRNEPGHYHHDFRYIFVLENDEQIVLQEEEVLGGEWFELAEDTGNPSTDIILQKLRAVLG